MSAHSHGTEGRRSAIAAATLLALLAAGCAPHQPGAYLDGGIRAIQQGQNRSAVRQLRRAVQEDPHSASAQCNLGIACSRLGRSQEAEQAFRQAAGLTSDPRPLEFLAQLYRDQGQNKDAMATLTEAAHRSPRSPRILTALALAQLPLEGPSAARATLLHLLEFSPGYGPALFNLAVLNRDYIHDPAEAKRYFREFLATNPDPQYAVIARQGLAPEPAVPKPQVTASKAPAARPSAPMTPLRAPDRVTTADPTVSAALTAARAAVQRGEFDQALVTLKHAAAQRPDSPDVPWETIQLYDKHLNDPAMTAQLLDEFMEHFPSDSRIALAKTRRASLPYATAVTNQSSNRKTVDRLKATDAYNSGVQAQQAGKWNQAVAAYRQAVEFDPNMVNAYFNLGLTFMSAGDLVSAKSTFREALAVNPAMVSAHYMLGLVHRELNEDQDAVAQLSEVLKAEPGNADAYLALGMIYRKSPAQAPLARKNLERYLALTPAGPAATQVQEWLKSLR